MFVCMYVCIDVLFVYICMYVYTHTHVCMYIHTHTFLCVCANIFSSDK